MSRDVTRARVSVELRMLEERIPRCRRCPELRAYCAQVAQEKRRSYSDWTYWGRPVPAFGDPRARLAIIGLAPGAHGANRTGRMFTGDRSGDFLYAALHRAGLASQSVSTSRDDGLVLQGVWITAALRCAPPANRPEPHQLANCKPWIESEIALVRPRVLLALGAIAWSSALDVAVKLGSSMPRPKPRFAHGARAEMPPLTILGCYHPSQQNTFTGRLTPAMIDAVLHEAKRCAQGE